jgi:hypothetical protein
MVTLEPVGQVLGGRDEVFDDAWDAVTAVIRLDGSRFGPRGDVHQPAWSTEIMRDYY